MKSIFISMAATLFMLECKAQDSSGVFEKISREIKEFKIDTSAVPSDKITNKIMELRSLRGGFNINEAIEFKIGEDLQKDQSSKESLAKIRESFKNGIARKWLDNAVTWIYRRHFSYKELKQLVKFYKTAAGRKMATDFPVIMLKTLAAAETIQKVLTGGDK